MAWGPMGVAGVLEDREVCPLVPTKGPVIISSFPEMVPTFCLSQISAPSSLSLASFPPAFCSPTTFALPLEPHLSAFWGVHQLCLGFPLGSVLRGQAVLETKLC